MHLAIVSVPFCMNVPILGFDSAASFCCLWLLAHPSCLSRESTRHYAHWNPASFQRRWQRADTRKVKLRFLLFLACCACVVVYVYILTEKARHSSSMIYIYILIKNNISLSILSNNFPNKTVYAQGARRASKNIYFEHPMLRTQYTIQRLCSVWPTAQ